MEAEVIRLTQQLIQKPSFTPNDAGCMDLLSQRMQGQGFHCLQQRFEDVDNLLIWHGDAQPALLFLGHTDVVPVGDENLWHYPPLSATIDQGMLYGRGAADMKGSVAAMVLAMEKFVGQNPKHQGKIALMLTSDEEGAAENGIKKFIPFVAEQHKFDYCLVGEPSSSTQLADTVRIGRRGSLHVKIEILGKQGHVAYPQHAENPIFKAAATIAQLAETTWDTGNQDFPPTSFQISNITTDNQAANVVPGKLNIQANFRYSPESSPQSLQQKLQHILDQQQLKYSLDWKLSGQPFHCQNEFFKQQLTQSIEQICGITPEFNTAGGTSDGRFVAQQGIATMELGPLNASIHQVNESVAVNDLLRLESIYLKLIQRLLG